MRFKKVSGWSADGSTEFTGISLPAVRIVCPLCDGRGTHVNPAIDGHGLSHEDFAADPDFAESYFAGVYDVRCEYCHGARVVDEVDEATCTTKLTWFKGLLRYRNGLELEQMARAERADEARIGA